MPENFAEFLRRTEELVDRERALQAEEDSRGFTARAAPTLYDSVATIQAEGGNSSQHLNPNYRNAEYSRATTVDRPRQGDSVEDYAEGEAAIAVYGGERHGAFSRIFERATRAFQDRILVSNIGRNCQVAYPSMLDSMIQRPIEIYWSESRADENPIQRIHSVNPGLHEINPIERNFYEVPIYSSINNFIRPREETERRDLQAWSADYGRPTLQSQRYTNTNLEELVERVEQELGLGEGNPTAEEQPSMHGEVSQIPPTNAGIFSLLPSLGYQELLRQLRSQIYNLPDSNQQNR